MPLGYTRIGRLALESIVYSDSKVTSISEALLGGDIVTSHEHNLALELRDLLVTIGDDYSILGNEVYQFLEGENASPSKKVIGPDCTWLTSNAKCNIVDRLPKFIANPESTHLDITITTIDWKSVATALSEALSSFVKTKRKGSLHYEDPYSLSEVPVISVKFISPHGGAMLLENNSSPATLHSQPPKADEKIGFSGDLAGNSAAISDSVNGGETRKRKSSLAELTPSAHSNTSYRSSKRVKARADEQTLDNVDVSEDESFFEQLSSFLVLCDVKFESMIPVFLDKEFPPRDQYLYDFKILLQNWDDDQAEVFVKFEAPDMKNGNKQPIMQMLDSAALGNGENTAVIKNPEGLKPSGDDVSQFINMINAGNFHLQEVRVQLIYTLFGGSKDSRRGDKSSLVDDYWPSALTETVRRTIESCESIIYSQIKMIMLSRDPLTTDILQVCEGIFEFFVDSYLSACRAQQRSNSITDSKGNNSNLVKEQQELLRIRLYRWRSLWTDLVSLNYGRIPEILELRHVWASIFLSTNEDSPEECLESFERFKAKSIECSDNKDGSESFDVEFSNFPNIPRLSLESCNTQISKYRAAAIFGRVFESPSSLSPDGYSSTSQIQLLESILMPNEKQRLPEHESISQFLSTASFQFRYHLWFMLLDAYDRNGETQKSFDGYLRIFISSVDEMTNDAYLVKSERQRSILLLKSLNICLDICKTLQRMLLSEDIDVILEKYSIDEATRCDALTAMIKLLRMLYIYILLDDAITNNIIQAPSHPSWVNVSQQLEEFVVYSWSLFYCLFRMNLPKERTTSDILNDILSIIHEALGSRGYCGTADGIFLDMIIRELARLDWPQSEADMIQCLHCRYDLTLANDTFTPYDHHSTTAGDIDRKTALRLSKFIMRMILSKKNLTQSILRTEIKNALDEFYQAIGDPDSQEIVSVAHNSGILEEYLSLPLTSDLFKETLKGRSRALSFISPSSLSSGEEVVQAGQEGFYYILGLLQLSQFRVRKRTGPGRTEDIEDAIKFFKLDLVCNTNRFESWCGLAQSYDALSEEDLTWDAEKLHTSDLRKTIAVNQRRSILACAMAVRVYLADQELIKQQLPAGGSSPLLLENSSLAAGDSSPSAGGSPPTSYGQSSHYQQLASHLWGVFAKLIYNASRPPMQMETFNDIPERIFCGPEGLYSRPIATPISIGSILNMVDICLRLAISSNVSDWSYYYLRAKVLYKLNNPSSKKVLLLLSKAINLLPEKSTNNTGSHSAVLEPHYKLVSLACKYVTKGRLSPESATDFLKLTPYFESKIDYSRLNIPEVDTPINKFFAHCIATLVRIRGVDKRKWHHRPTYRIARILYDHFGDAVHAKEEMSGFFSLKTIVKAPIHIWKPELERPGEQFEFRCRYVIFYVDLLRETNDFEALCILARKLRKFGAGIARHQEAWDYVCSGACQTLKQFLDIPLKYTEQVINSLVFEEFNTQSQNLLASVEDSSQAEKEIPALVNELDSLAELRRLNNGFGSTAALDDAYVAVYLKIYQNFLAVSTTISSVPEPVAVVTPKPVALTVAPSRMSIQSLMSPEVTDPLQSRPTTPVSDLNNPSRADTPVSSAVPTTAVGTTSTSVTTPQKEKIRVNRRDIITRVNAFLKAAVSKVPKQS